MIKVVHLVYSLDVGGLERFMVDMINRFTDGYQHVVVSLTGATDFRYELNSCVPVYCLGKKPGHDLGIHLKLARLLRAVKPSVLHTYNLATIEYHAVARFVGVKWHVHAEHGRDSTDPKGLNWKHNMLRRFMSPFIQEFIAVSDELSNWLIGVVKIPVDKVSMIPNGVNLNAFNQQPKRLLTAPIKFLHVARLQAVKNQALLLKAFDECCAQCEQHGLNIPLLTIVGDGPDRPGLTKICQKLIYKGQIEFTGMQSNVAPFYQQSDVFILTSLAEGTPMTILEAMSCGLPIIATQVGGVPQLVDSTNGWLVRSEDLAALVAAMFSAVAEPSSLASKGVQSRNKIADGYDQGRCDQMYQALYQRALT